MSALKCLIIQFVSPFYCCTCIETKKNVNKVSQMQDSFDIDTDEIGKRKLNGFYLAQLKAIHYIY